MWIRLRQPLTGLFFPSETLAAGTVVSIGTPRAKKLIAAGKALQVAFPAGEPDDVAEKRKKFKQANPGPLWDEQRKRTVTAPAQPVIDPEAAATIRKNAAANLNARIQQLLGPRSAAAWRARERERAKRYDGCKGRASPHRPALSECPARIEKYRG